MTRTNTTHKCTYSPHSGPVVGLPAPNIFPLAKETFAKGKMFWNYYTSYNSSVYIYISLLVDSLLPTVQYLHPRHVYLLMEI